MSVCGWVPAANATRPEAVERTATAARVDDGVLSAGPAVAVRRCSERFPESEASPQPDATGAAKTARRRRSARTVVVGMAGPGSGLIAFTPSRTIGFQPGRQAPGPG